LGIVSAMTIRTELADGWWLRVDGDGPVAAVGAIPATVPGTVHTDLLAAGLIPDPYLDRNETDLDWIGRAVWVYERTIDHSVTPGERTVLLFEGLDTIATVRVNGAVVATTRNMHRRYEVPVDLRDGPNRLEVRFDPAGAYAESERERLGALPNQYPAPFNYVRKMACNFGWDWDRAW
jgi:beta-mannosidase